jgi:hypothetical protein
MNIGQFETENRNSLKKGTLFSVIFLIYFVLVAVVGHNDINCSDKNIFNTLVEKIDIISPTYLVFIFKGGDKWMGI